MSNILNCMLCNGAAFSFLPYFYHYQEKRIRIARCSSCGLSMLHPMPSPEEIVALYNLEYFDSAYHCGTSDGSYVQEIETMRREFRPYLAMIRQLCPAGKYLEIGCAGGATLAEARAQNFEAIGVELSSEMAEWGRKNLQLDIRAGALEQQRFSDNSFDVVYLGDVIEHLLTPKEVLAEIRRVLKPQGIVALAYPMELNHVVPRLRRLLRWQRQSPNKPYHLFYYTTKTMKRLLEHCGFEIKTEKVDKTLRRRPLWVYAADLPNYLLTQLTGKWGDRGFTIARSLKKSA
jgi:2-polyprenyl-3-methyl-5-hydroxy-6-metoxy-1,4-benzoquinol methylase